jgi:hypothetical protein
VDKQVDRRYTETGRKAQRSIKKNCMKEMESRKKKKQTERNT